MLSVLTVSLLLIFSLNGNNHNSGRREDAAKTRKVTQSAQPLTSPQMRTSQPASDNAKGEAEKLPAVPSAPSASSVPAAAGQDAGMESEEVFLELVADPAN